MNFKKLADLLYPDVTTTVEYWQNFYKKRPKVEVTRIAPSPTGFLHLGTAYGAMIDKLIAGTDGIFYFRLEDTDKKREIEASGDIAYDMLCAYDIIPKEGFCSGGKEKGEYGPYTQSKRLDIYNCFAKALVAKGRAFPCFCEKAEGKEEVLKRREDELKDKDDIETKDACRSLSYEDIENNIKSGKKFALRLLSNGDGEKTILFNDLIKGEREIKANDKDIVLIKSNGIPVYAFAHVVDDSLMGTTTVVRGEEWFASVAAHLELFDAFNLKPTKYVHTPVICKLDEDGNKRKLSKRKDEEADVRYFIRKGYPKEAVIEYLLNLINSDFEIWKANNPDMSYSEFPFSVSKMGSNNPMFDIIKLGDIAKTIISKMSKQEVFERVFAWAKEFDSAFASELDSKREYALKVFNIDREGDKPRKDIAAWSDIRSCLGYMFDCYSHFDSLADYEIGEYKKENIKEILLAYKDLFNLEDDKQVWFERIKAMSEKCGYALRGKDYKSNPELYKGDVSAVCTFIRLALTGRKNSPDLYEIMNALGFREITGRLDKLISLL